jgi:hypothetical protein
MRSIWAVAVNTVKQALRMKVAFIFLLLLVLLLPVMAFSSTGDNTLKGRLQTFVSYGLSLTSILLCLLTIIVSIHTVASDIEHRQIYTVITKPIRRFEFLLGKLLGVVLLSTGLLVLFLVLIYAAAAYMPRFYRATQADLIEVKNEFLTARKALTPPDPDVSKEVADALKKLISGGNIDQVYTGMSPKEITDQIANTTKLAKRSADVGQQLLWEFYNVKPRDPNGSIFVKFKLEVSVTPPDSQVYSQWGIGDYRPYKYGTQSKGDGEFYPIQRKDPVRKFREIEVPADAVADDGYLAVAFYNPPLNTTSVIFPLEDGLEVLYKADSFTANFIRAGLLILSRLLFLACLGILTSTFLSFPVAILFCLVIFFTASVSGFVIESFDFLSANMAVVYSYTIKWLIRLLPQFDKFNPSTYLVPAKLLSWSVVARVALVIVCIKSLLLLIFALVIFSFREIARITV